MGKGRMREDSKLLSEGQRLEREIDQALRKEAMLADSSRGLQTNILILLCISACIFNQISFAQLPAFFPNHAQLLVGVSHTWIGLILGIQGAFGVLTNMIAPSIIRTFSNMPCLIGAQIILATSTMVFGFVTESMGRKTFITLAMVLRSVQGGSDSIVQAAATSLILDSVPAQTTGVYVGLIEGVRSIGTLLGPVIGGYLYLVGHFEHGNFRLPIIVIGSVLVFHAGAFLLLCGSVEFSRITSSVSKESVISILKVPQVPLVLFTLGACTFVLGFFEPTIAIHLTEQPFKLSTGTTGLLMSGTMIAMGITAAISGMLERSPISCHLWYD